MTDQTEKLLAVLWIYGPATNKEIAARAAMIPSRCYQSVYRLRRQGLATVTAAGDAYAITLKGKIFLKFRDRRLLRHLRP